MDADYYINWDCARECLIVVIKEATTAIRLVEAVRINSDTIGSNDLLVREFLQSFELSEEQVRQLSMKYIELAKAVKRASLVLSQGEISNEP